MYDELYHFGIPGMKWGVRKNKNSYKSTSIRSALARRSNERVDKSFKNWRENTKKRDDAIALGKSANDAKIAYESNRSNKGLKSEYKTANKQYKKALSKNTTYRKGVVRQEVNRDIARKYLSAAKKIKKQIDSGDTNKNLKKQYNRLMSNHDIERAKGRRATRISSNRSRLVASIKRARTMAIKTAASAAVVAAGAYTINRYLRNHNVTINGESVNLSAQKLRDVGHFVNSARKIFDYI